MRSAAPRKPARAPAGPRVDRDSVLIAVGELVRREVDLDALLRQVIDTVTRAMDADRGTFYLVDRARGELFSKAAHLPELREIRLALGQGVAGHVARSGEAVNLSSSSRDPRFHGAVDRTTGYATRSMLCVPVFDRGGEILGVLQLLNKRGAAFSGDDEALLRALASQVAMIVESTSLYPQLRAPSPAPLHYRFNGIVGQGERMRRVYDVVGRAAATDATVLVTGETGTGKGLIARAIHFNSKRAAAPFVAVDCASLPATLIENELFGHERGAYTGADRRALGKFEAADGGTVFLDEIGEVPLPLQSKLLRVIQDREFERVGGRRSVKVDVRIVAATNRNLEDMVARQRFREDLYYRLRVLSLPMPALRERGPADLDQLAGHFLSGCAQRHGKPVQRFSAAARARLHAHAWPGNIRELENCIEGAVVLCNSDIIDVPDLPLPPEGGAAVTRGKGPGRPAAPLGRLRWDEMERLYIEAVLAEHAGNRSAAARAMGIGRSTLLRKIQQLAITG
ncbi:MAG: sigma 54-interacting transcriptional regulator [Nannocystis sp.]|nr:sigma 54-interacting transcriptional regulator [Nannocystis sp.]MBA3547063.1 sigma 54-interacting transcriptional regulator [Nannocystis sp.]